MFRSFPVVYQADVSGPGSTKDGDDQPDFQTIKQLVSAEIAEQLRFLETDLEDELSIERSSAIV